MLTFAVVYFAVGVGMAELWLLSVDKRRNEVPTTPAQGYLVSVLLWPLVLVALIGMIVRRITKR